MPPQAIASPIPTTPAAPKQPASDPRTAQRSRTTDGGRAADAPSQRNDRARAPKERSSFDDALDRARKIDEPAATPAKSGETAPEPTDSVADTPVTDAADRPVEADDKPPESKGEHDAAQDGEAVDAETVSNETSAADSDESAQRIAGAVAATNEPRGGAGARSAEVSGQRSERPLEGKTTADRAPERAAQPVDGKPKTNTAPAQATESAPDADGADAPLKTNLPRGTAKVDKSESQAQATDSSERTPAERTERAERAVRLSERIVPESEEPAPRVEERPANGERVRRPESTTVFGDADGATESSDIEPRPVPETQPVRVERPVVSRERTVTEPAQSTATDGEGEAPTPASPGAVQAANAGARLSSDDDGAQDRHKGASRQKAGVERVESAGRPAEPTTTNATNANTAHEPRGVGESRASTANLAQARPEAAQHEQATVAAANRGLDVALKQQGGSVQMRLAPESLGALKVEMTISRGVVAATLQASTPEARELLTRNIETLRSSLEAKGLSVERLSITLAPASQGGSSGQSFNTNSGPQSQHQPAQGSGGQQSSDHDAGGERSRGFFEHHERHRQDQRGAKDHETDERLFKYRMGLHTIA